MDDSDERLIALAVAGDAGALASLLEQVGVQLHAELESRIGAVYRGIVDADDVWQVTCLEAFLRIRTLVPAGPAAFLSWLRHISNNNLRDAIREVGREKRPPPAMRLQSGPEDESYATLLASLPCSATSVSRAASRRELRAFVDNALRQLPGDYEQVLRLYELDGLSAPEVAERMGRSHGAVRMLLARARDCLSGVLGSASHYL